MTAESVGFRTLRKRSDVKFCGIFITPHAVSVKVRVEFDNRKREAKKRKL
jgi:hypothetical protein